MFREGYAIKLLADVMKIIAEEKRTDNNSQTDKDGGKTGDNKQGAEEKKDEDTN